jgi:L-arabinokinase
MRQSHHSYSACGLGSEATDLLLRLVDTAHPEGVLFGARITGGGSGGTVAVIGTADARPAIDNVVSRFADETGIEPYVFTGSSPGAGEFGVVQLSCEE